MNPRSWFRRGGVRDPLQWTIVIACTALLLTGIGHSGVGAETASKPDPAAAKASPTLVTPGVHAHRVVAYYFHTTQRCASCRAIEAYSREAIERAFADQLKDGRLLWKVVNVEVKGNEHFVKDYRLYTKSVVLVNEVRGRPAEWKNLEKVWQLLHDKDKFLRYVQDETRAYLTERS
jgi:hypothetical protein